MSFAVVVVLHRSRDELARCCHARAPQLIVVDAGPDDGGAELAASHGAAVIDRRDNPGFGAAYNLALEHVTQPVTVLLNPDTDADGEALAELVAAREPAGLHAPRLLNPDGSVQRSAHPLPGTLGAFMPALVHPPLLPARSGRVEPFRAQAPRTVGWAIAACLAARTARSTARPFDPRIHLFAEDMDLCLRARAEGIRDAPPPRPRVTHTGRHSVENEPFEQLARNRRDCRAHARTRRARRLDDAAQLLTFATRAVVKRPNDRERAQLRRAP